MKKIKELLTSDICDLGYQIRGSVRHFILKLRRSLSYASHGFNSEDWDATYALDDFVWKLRRVQSQLTRDGEELQLEDMSSAVVEEIGEVCGLLDSVLHDLPQMAAYAELNKKFGPHTMFIAVDEPGKPFICKRVEETFENHSKVKRIERKAYAYAAELTEQQWAKALEIIKEKLFGWWS